MTHPQSFTIHVPGHLHKAHHEKAGKLNFVKHLDHQSGVVAPPEGEGLEYRYESLPEQNAVKITILRNPHAISTEDLKAKILEGMAQHGLA